MSKILSFEERKQRFEAKWPEWKLIEFNGYNGPCKIEHQCGCIKEYETYFNVEKRGPTCQKCVDTKKWYWNIGDVVGDLTITNRRSLPNTLQEYQYKCNICGFDCSKPLYIKGEYYDEYWAKGHSIKMNQRNGGIGCACCGKKVVQPGINDIATTMPDIVQYFYDKSEIYKWSRSSEHEEKIICPICNTVQPRKMRISNLVHEGFDCINCGKNISYPEKLMYFLLKELSIDFRMHRIFDWSKNVYDKYDNQFHAREYDFYIPSINTIIEMHGSQHYREKISWNDDMSLDHRQQIDKDKQELAIKNGYKYIIIDCRDSNKNYIKSNILKSELATTFNLNQINWDKISRSALSGISKLVVEDKEFHPEKSTVELAEQYGVVFSTIIRWLKKAGIYDCSKEQQNAGLKRSYPIYSPELGKAFRSVRLASQEIGVGARTIYAALSPNIPHQKHAGIHPITGEYLSWERWTMDQYNEWCRIH